MPSIARRRMLAAAIIAATLAGAPAAFAQSKNGFDLSAALVPVDEILQGGPPRDGIPAIDNPRFVPAAGASFLAASDRVLGVVRNGIAKAYPIRILNWHEIVNDRFADDPIVVTFCPLCGSGMSFLAKVDGHAASFGVSGLLYNSDVLLYDRKTESLWSQIMARAVSGAQRGKALELVATDHTSWADWRRRHPNTLVLAIPKEHRRDYGRDPYEGYDKSEGLYFPVKLRAAGYHPKETVIGVRVGKHSKAYPFSELSRSKGEVRDRIGGRELVVHFDAEHRSARVVASDGNPVFAVTAFWFAWYAFHPGTEVHKAR